MATATIKFLQRKRIKQEDVRIRLERVGRTRRFTVECDFSSYSFPDSAVVVVEARTLLETLRFTIGTIGSGVAPTFNDISRFDAERITFSLYVLDSATARKFGSAELIRPQAEQPDQGAPESLLPVDIVDDLDGCVWAIRYMSRDSTGRTDAPVLVFDRRAARGSAAVFVAEPHVRALVLPAAFHAVLERIVWVEQYEFDPDGDGWRNGWLRLAQHLVGESPPLEQRADQPDVVHYWIDRAVAASARTQDFLDVYLQQSES